MKKWRIIAASLLSNLLLCTSVFAYSIDFKNSDSSNWDNPANGKLEAYKVENKILSTISSVQWTADQIKQFQSRNNLKQFFPALIYKVDQSDQLRSKLMFTNLPGAKFTRKDAIYNEGEEIKLSILNTSDVVENKEYTFFTAWLHTREGNPTLTLHSIQRYSQPNGTLNDLPKTEDTISTVNLNEAAALDRRFQNLNLPDSFDSPFNQYTDGEINKKVKSYALIDSKEKLDKFKTEAAKLLKATSDDKEVQFAITFNKPVYASLDYIAEKYNLTISQVYAAGIKENKEEFTVSWFDTNKDNSSLMRLDNKNGGFGIFSITELEGTARVEDLKRISSSSEVDVVEIEENGRMPTGVHWLNKRYYK